jgi:hypothetical protein
MSAGSFSAGVSGATGSFSTGVGGSSTKFSGDVDAAGTGFVGAVGTAAGSLVGAVGSMVGAFVGGKLPGGLFSNQSGGSGGMSIGSADKVSPTFNDCFFEGFTDTCTGMNINALTYTNPSGVVSYINPMTYNSTGGVSNYQGSGSSGGSSSYGLAPIFMARGGIPNRPTLAMVAEKGEEMVLPNNITMMFLRLAAMGFRGESSTNDSPITIILHIDGEEITRVVTSRMKSKLNVRGLKTH